jgi:hypothetical protein
MSPLLAPFLVSLFIRVRGRKQPVEKVGIELIGTGKVREVRPEG